MLFGWCQSKVVEYDTPFYQIRYLALKREGVESFIQAQTSTTQFILKDYLVLQISFMNLFSNSKHEICWFLNRFYFFLFAGEILSSYINSTDFRQETLKYLCFILLLLNDEITVIKFYKEKVSLGNSQSIQRGLAHFAIASFDAGVNNQHHFCVIHMSSVLPFFLAPADYKCDLVLKIGFGKFKEYTQFVADIRYWSNSLPCMRGLCETSDLLDIKIDDTQNQI